MIFGHEGYSLDGHVEVAEVGAEIVEGTAETVGALTGGADVVVAGGCLSQQYSKPKKWVV